MRCCWVMLREGATHGEVKKGHTTGMGVMGMAFSFGSPPLSTIHCLAAFNFTHFFWPPTSSSSSLVLTNRTLAPPGSPTSLPLLCLAHILLIPLTKVTHVWTPGLPFHPVVL